MSKGGELFMTSARKSIVFYLPVLMLISLYVVGCGPTNGYPPLAGEYLYVANDDGRISEFSINTSTGALTNLASFVAGSTICCSSFLSLTMHPNNEFVYATDNSDNQILGFDIGDFSGTIFA